MLSDESKCEFIVGCDTFMTDSAKYCDILLPDAMRAEQLNMSTNGYSEYYWGVTVGGPAQEPPFECRPIYDVHADIAEKLGVRDKFTLGKTQDEWIEELYKAGAAADPELPSWEGILEQGVYKRKLPTAIAFEENVKDPVGHPWNTPSGKIEIYSEALAKIAEDRELEGRLTEGQVILAYSDLRSRRGRLWCRYRRIPALHVGLARQGAYPLFVRFARSAQGLQSPSPVDQSTRCRSAWHSRRRQGAREEPGR